MRRAPCLAAVGFSRPPTLYTLSACSTVSVIFCVPSLLIKGDIYDTAVHFFGRRQPSPHADVVTRAVLMSLGENTDDAPITSAMTGRDQTLARYLDKLRTSAFGSENEATVLYHIIIFSRPRLSTRIFTPMYKYGQSSGRMDRWTRRNFSRWVNYRTASLASRLAARSSRAKITSVCCGNEKDNAITFPDGTRSCALKVAAELRGLDPPVEARAAGQLRSRQFLFPRVRLRIRRTRACC
jgi:hypothetical protein